ncbi:MAG: hypothetical protein LBS89_08930, partial [Zoogloeaceae bacterium]|nr:hypothetical protein [Zoogloeaceae bacterium]
MNRWQKLSAACGLLTLLGSIVLSVLFGVSINNALGFTLGAVLLILGFSFRFMPRWLKLLTRLGIAGTALFFLAMLGLMRQVGTQDTVTFDEEVVIVLGSGIRGTQIPRML